MSEQAKVEPVLSAEEWRRFIHGDRKSPGAAYEFAGNMDASGATEEEQCRAYLREAVRYLFLSRGLNGPPARGHFTWDMVDALRASAEIVDAMGAEAEKRGDSWVSFTGPMMRQKADGLRTTADAIERILLPRDMEAR